MQAESAPTVPCLTNDRPVDELLLPVVAESLHDRAVPLVAALAAAWQLPVRLVHVTDSISSVDDDLAAVAEGFHSWYPSIELAVEHVYGDDPARAIASEVRAQTLPVVATDHIDRWRFKQSVAEALVEEAGVPVLLVGPNVTKAMVRSGPLDGEIVVGLDGSAEAEAAVAPAIGLARSNGHRVWLVTVVPQPSPEEVASTANPGRYLQQLAERFDPEVEVRWEVIQGNDPVAAIESFAERRNARFVVVSAKGRDNPSHHAMASITSGLASVAARPVVVVKAARTPTIGV